MNVINRNNFISPEIYDLEVAAIFKKEWLFAAFRKDIPNKRDWKTIELFNHSIIIYNTGSEIKAFQNVCPHRFNRIFTENAGNGPLMCGYHLWAFNEKGELLGKRDLYPQPEKPVCLKSYPLEIVGDFIFVSLTDPPAHSLSDQLGEEMTELLVWLSNRIYERTANINVPHNCNWKFILENVIEAQHCIALHQATLVKAGYCKTPPSVLKNMSRNSYFIVPSSNEASEKKRSFIVNHVFGKENVTTVYKHTYIYPNLLLSDFEGVSFTIGVLLPRNESVTDFDLSFYIAQPKTTNVELLNEYKDISNKFGIKVFEEDRVVLENVQKGVREVEHDGFQYISEKRVEWFIKAYDEALDEHNKQV